MDVSFFYDKNLKNKLKEISNVSMPIVHNYGGVYLEEMFVFELDRKNKDTNNKIVKVLMSDVLLYKILSNTNNNLSIDQLMLLKFINNKLDEDILSTYKRIKRRSIDFQNKIIYGNMFDYQLKIDNKLHNQLALFLNENEEILMGELYYEY